MTQNYKRIAKNTLFLYFRMLIIMAVSFYTVRVVLDTLGVNDFGIYNLVASFVMILAFLNSTLTSGTQRFLTFEIGKEDFVKLKQTFSTALLIHLALAFLMLIFAETVGLWFLYEKMNIPIDRFDAAFWAYQFAVASSMVMVIQVPYNALIIAHEKMHIFAYISIVEAILKLLIVYLLLIVSSDKLISYAIFMFIASLLIAFTYRIYVIRNYKESHFEFVFDRNIVKSMVHFSGWNIFGTLGSILSAQGINIILNIFFGPVAVAARALSSQVGGGLNQFAGAFQQAVTPQITKLFASNQIEELNRLLYQNAKYAFLLLWFLALPVLLETDYILSIWLVEIPENTALFCQLMIVHGLIGSLNRPYVMAIHATGNMKQTNVTAGVLLLLVIPVSYVLLDNGFSIIAPFIVYIIATILCFVIELYYLKKWIQVSIKGLFINTFIPIILIIVLTTTLPFWMQTYFEESFMRFFIVGIVSCVSVVFFTYVIALNRLEKEKFQVMIKNRIQKRKVK
ncbi:MAG: oligosaccharide flippase family protein [Sulfurimonas sp.]|nr:oligosaccharide flippase family protein [Sulfurimonas sp.]